MSVWLPGVKGTTMRTSWLGKLCAEAGVGPMPPASTWIAAPANEARAAKVKRVRTADVMVVPSCDRTYDFIPGANALSRLFVGSQIGDQIVGFGRLGDAAEWHAIALHLGLGIDQIGAKIGLVPDEVRALHRVGIAKIVERRRLTAEYALQVRPDRVGLFSVARRTGNKQFLAMGSIRRHRADAREHHAQRSSTHPQHHRHFHFRFAPEICFRINMRFPIDCAWYDDRAQTPSCTFPPSSGRDYAPGSMPFSTMTWAFAGAIRNLRKSRAAASCAAVALTPAVWTM